MNLTWMFYPFAPRRKKSLKGRRQMLQYKRLFDFTQLTAYGKTLDEMGAVSAQYTAKGNSDANISRLITSI